MFAPERRAEFYSLTMYTQDLRKPLPDALTNYSDIVYKLLRRRHSSSSLYHCTRTSWEYSTVFGYGGQEKSEGIFSLGYLGFHVRSTINAYI